MLLEVRWALGVQFCSVGVEMATFTTKRTTDYAGILPGRLDFSLKLRSGRSVLVGVLCRRGVCVHARVLFKRRTCKVFPKAAIPDGLIILLRLTLIK